MIFKYKIDLKDNILLLNTFVMWGTYYGYTQIEILKIKKTLETTKTSNSVLSNNPAN
jgi:hypothetical protein